MARTCGVLYILTSKCASRHNGVHFFNIRTSKSGANMWCFEHFDLEMCFAPQRRSLFRHRNCQKWSDNGCVLYILTSKCASRHNGVHFFDISTAKSGPDLVLPKVVRTLRQVLRLLCSDKTRLGNQIHVHNHFSFIRYMHLALLTICKIKHTSCYVPGSSAFPTIESGIHHPRKTLQIQIIHCIALQASVGIAAALQTRHFIMLPADLLLKILQASASWYST